MSRDIQLDLTGEWEVNFQIGSTFFAHWRNPLCSPTNDVYGIEAKQLTETPKRKSFPM